MLYALLSFRLLVGSTFGWPVFSPSALVPGVIVSDAVRVPAGKGNKQCRGCDEDSQMMYRQPADLGLL